MHSFHPELFLRYSAKDIVTIILQCYMKIKYPLLSNKKFSFSLCANVSDFIEHWLLCMFSWTSSWRDKTLVSFTGLFFCWTPQLGISILQQKIHKSWLSPITPPPQSYPPVKKLLWLISFDLFFVFLFLL